MNIPMLQPDDVGVAIASEMARDVVQICRVDAPK